MKSRGFKRQILAAAASSLCVLNVGVMLGWTSPVMEELRGPNSPIPMTVDESSWVVSVHNVGVMLGSVPFGVMADRWGRKPCLLAIGPLQLATWAALLYARTVPGLVAVRVAQGLLAGGAYTVVPVYTGEIAGPRVRGALGTVFQVMLHAGIVLVYAAGACLDYGRLTYAVLGVQAAVTCALFAGIPETPHYYAMKDRLTDARRTLAWLRGGDGDGTANGGGGGGVVASDIEPDALAESVTGTRGGVGGEKGGGGIGGGQARSSVARLFADRVSVRSLLIVQGMSVARVMAGVVLTISYASVAFAEMHVAAADANALSIGFGVALLASTLPAAALADRAGRRPLMIASCLGCAACDAAVAAYFYLDRHTAYDVAGYGWLCAAAVAGTSVAYSAGLGSLFSTINCELFPSATRSAANAINTVTLTAVSLVALKAYPALAADGGMYRNYLLYTACSLVAAVCFWLWLPETKGKTFAAIQAQLRG